MTKKYRLLKTVAGLTAMLILSPCAMAQEPDLADLRKELKQSLDQIKEQQKRIEDLEKKVEAMDRSTSKGTPKGTPETDATSGRLDYIEDSLFDLQDQVGSRPSVKVFDAKTFTLGGFLTQQFTTVSGDDATAASFNATQLELLLSADVTDNISFFAAQGFLWETDAPGNDTGVEDPNSEDPEFGNHELNTPLILANATYTHSDAMQLQVGRMITPHGIINIEHFPPTLLNVKQPMFLRPFDGESIFPNFIAGAQFKGKQFYDGDTVRYNLYAGTRTSGPENTLDGEQINLGARAAYTFDEYGVTFGANTSTGRRPGGTSYNMYGFDFLYDKDNILWKNEIFFTNENGEEDRLGFYTQPAYRFTDEWIAFYRFDYFDDGNRSPIDAARDNPSIAREHTLGVNFLPTSIVRVRGEVALRDTKDDTTNEDVETTRFQLSTTVSF